MGSATLNPGSSSPQAIPAGATNLIIECYGAGGGGGGGGGTNKYGGDGGGGGAYSKLTIASPGTSYAFSVGSGGAGVSHTDGQAGGDTWFGSTTTCLAKGGHGGYDYDTPGSDSAGGSSGSGYGDVKYSGGNGAVGATTYSGGGGGGAGTTNNGGNASGMTGGTGVAQGGDGGAGTDANSGNGGGGLQYSGGGAGATKNGVPGSGYDGVIYLSWTDPASSKSQGFILT